MSIKEEIRKTNTTPPARMSTCHSNCTNCANWYIDTTEAEFRNTHAEAQVEKPLDPSMPICEMAINDADEGNICDYYQQGE